MGSILLSVYLNIHIVYSLFLLKELHVRMERKSGRIARKYGNRAIDARRPFAAGKKMVSSACVPDPRMRVRPPRVKTSRERAKASDHSTGGGSQGMLPQDERKTPPIKFQHTIRHVLRRCLKATTKKDQEYSGKAGDEWRLSVFFNHAEEPIGCAGVHQHNSKLSLFVEKTLSETEVTPASFVITAFNAAGKQLQSRTQTRHDFSRAGSVDWGWARYLDLHELPETGGLDVHVEVYPRSSEYFQTLDEIKMESQGLQTTEPAVDASFLALRQELHAIRVANAVKEFYENKEVELIALENQQGRNRTPNSGHMSSFLKRIYDGEKEICMPALFSLEKHQIEATAKTWCENDADNVFCTLQAQIESSREKLVALENIALKSAHRICETIKRSSPGRVFSMMSLPHFQKDPMDNLVSALMRDGTSGAGALMSMNLNDTDLEETLCKREAYFSEYLREPFHCNICMETVKPGESAAFALALSTDTCGCHSSLCQRCFKKYALGFHMDAARITEHGIPCFNGSCGRCISEKTLSLVFSDEQMRKTKHLILNAAVAKDPSSKWCSNDACSGIAKKIADRNAAACSQCTTLSCTQCPMSYHPGKKCEEVWDAGVVDLKNQEGWQNCPKCNALVEKSTGCDHMTCTMPGCDGKFCYFCGSSPWCEQTCQKRSRQPFSP